MNSASSTIPFLRQLACRLLADAGYADWCRGYPEIIRLAGDGSQRRFYRLEAGSRRRRTFLLVAPASGHGRNLAEAGSAFLIGRHLHGRGIPVPEIYAFDPDSGLIICEDFGNELLYDLVRPQAAGRRKEALQRFYPQAVALLARMQVRGAAGFDPSWCWQSRRYDRRLMIQRESDYFLDAFCRHYLGMVAIDPRVRRDCLRLAGKAAAAPADFFLHRDFQCRNLMVRQGRIGIIDFQGGRLGPLAYDLASLLIDPYADLAAGFQDELLHLYLKELTSLISYDVKRFRQEYQVLALQRNLQIVGAFAFLSGQRHKPFFRRYIAPSLQGLRTRLAKPEGDDYPALRKLTAHCHKLLENEEKQ